MENYNLSDGEANEILMSAKMRLGAINSQTTLRGDHES